MYVNIPRKKQKGTPWECGFSLHSATTDTAHLRWFSHCFATIDNFCLVFLQWPNKTKIQKNKENMTRPNSLPLLPPLGCAILSVFVFLFFVFLVSWFFGFLVSCFLVRCWFFEGLARQHKSDGPRPHSLPVLPL